MESYSGYVKLLTDWYEDNVAEDSIQLRNKMLDLLFQENKLQEMVMLIGEDALPDDQRWVLSIAKLIRVGFLQQNTFDDTDTYVPLEKQYRMLKIMDYLYEKGLVGLKQGIPTSVLYNEKIFDDVIKMKYNIPNDDFSGIDVLRQDIDEYYDDLMRRYQD